MKPLNFYRKFHYLSLDVVLGALIGSNFVANLLGVHLPVQVSLILALTVWVIYTFDRLMDSKYSIDITSDRHVFHKQNHSLLVQFLIVGILTIIPLLFLIPYKTLLFGCALSAAVLIYFISIRLLPVKIVMYKELVIALLYTAGIFIGPLTIHQGPFESSYLLLIGIFFSIASVNLIIFSLHDQKMDEKAHFPSIVQSIGLKGSKILLWLSVGSLVFLLILSGSFDLLSFTQLFIFSMMCVTLVAIYFYPFKYYRWIGDGIFYLPVIFLL